MSQISPPLRILLVCAIAFLAAWTLFLRPGGSAAEPAAPAATTTAPASAAGGEAASTAPGTAVEAANTVAAKAQQSTGEAAPAAAPATGTAPAAAPAAAEAPAASAEVIEAAERSGLPSRLVKGIEDRKVLVLLFWNPKADDDRAVRREIREADEHHRKNVVFHTANIEDIARYQQITRGVNVQQSPAVVVVDRKLHAESLVGYSDHTLIEQSIDDALRAAK